MKLIHIFADTPHHYVPMKMFFENTCSVSVEQEFWVKGHRNSPNQEGFQHYENAKILLSMLKNTDKYAQIIFHGLFDVHVWKALIFTSMIKRCSCVFWGAELYRHNKKPAHLKERIATIIHKIFVQRLRFVFALNAGDAALGLKHFSREEIKVMPYPIIGVDALRDKLVQCGHLSSSDGSIRLLVGNSGAQSNNHIEALDALAHLSKDNVKVIVPLSYGGSSEYVEKIISYGRNLFGDKFVPLTDMLAKSDFDKLLMEMDGCVFAHDRQQGLYAVYAMFLGGKSVFLKEATTSFQIFQEQGFTINAFESIKKYNFHRLKDDVTNKDENNIKLMDVYYTEQALKGKWSEMLNDLGLIH